jgi:FixJ family two-component response regulator
MAVRRDVIAIIDDDRGMRGALSNMLLAFGYRTELYASAEEFIDSAVKSEASCLVLDIQLGGISGLELARYLSKFGLVFPIIFMTGLQDDTIRREAVASGCVAYLQKPFPADQLTAAITNAMSVNPHLR